MNFISLVCLLLDTRHIMWSIRVCNKMANSGYANVFKTSLALAPALWKLVYHQLGYLPFRFVHASSLTNWVRRCPESCARSAQKFSGKRNKEEENMKRPNGVRATYDTFFLCALQAGFGYAAVFSMLKEAYPWPSIGLRRCRSAIVSLE